MGTGKSGLFNGTKGSVRLPEHDSQLKHIFANRPGHLPDTPQNRQKLYEIACDKSKYVGTDTRGMQWYAEYMEDGGQYWVRTRNGVIVEGGYNKPPRQWDDETGFNRNPTTRR